MYLITPYWLKKLASWHLELNVLGLDFSTEEHSGNRYSEVRYFSEN